jgi:hypothetical protein
MLTRAFLLLLAMMTGLSAAQAADGVRVGGSTAAVRASASLPVVARAALDVKRQALSQSSQVFPEREPRLQTSCLTLEPVVAPDIPCTLRADRARE